MTRRTEPLESPRDVGQGPFDIGRPPAASDPWSESWAPPDHKELALKHAEARRRERELARSGTQNAPSIATARTPSSDAPQSPTQTTPRQSRRLLGAAAAIATAYWYWVVASVVIAIAIPLASGWSASTVLTGSMGPLISPGDVVAFADHDGAPLSPGTIIQFRDPVRPGETVTHRIVGLDDDGSYVTRGDANAAADSTPVPPDAIVGVARLVAPHAGLPHMWWHTGDRMAVAVWIVVTVGAAGIMSIHSQAYRGPSQPTRSRHRRISTILRPAVAVGLSVVVAAGIGTASSSNGAFASEVAPQPSTFAAAVSVGIEHLGMLGYDTCATDTTSTITITEPVESGDTIIVRIALARIRSNAAYTAADSGGNSYSLDAAVATNGSRAEAAILRAHVTMALSAGDQIVIQHPSARGVAVAAEAFSGVAATNPLVDTGAATGRSATPTVQVTASGSHQLALGHLAVDGATTVQQPPGATALVSETVSCNRPVTIASAWAETSGAGTLTYAPLLGDNFWWATVAVLYAGK